MAKKIRLDQIPVVPQEDDYFNFQIPSQTIFEEGAWTAPLVDSRRENEILPGKDAQWWKPELKKGGNAKIQLSDTIRKQRPWFAFYWDTAISKISRFDEMIWLYEIQARLDGHFAFGKPASHLSKVGLNKLYEVGRNSGITYEGWQRPDSKRLVSRYFEGNGWSDWTLFPVEMNTLGPMLSPFSINLSGSENSLLPVIKAEGITLSVRKFRSWLQKQRAKHNIPAPSRYAQKGEPRRAKPWLYIEALDDRAAGLTPSRVDLRRAFEWYRCRLGRWMQADLPPFPYECMALSFEDEFKDALNCAETQRFELTRGDWLVGEYSKDMRRTH